ncbi:MAG: hypothetical protein A2V64_04075 [Bacteroidetes bacterium RBG_13_43_22]|nr:MAG: hypothetical protein A2V64_04075 [Bacteroidetes bacterium RBG_13_43_22]
MGFAASWLNQRALFPEFIKEAPDSQTGIIVVVPAFDEPDIAPLLNSLNSCTEPDCKTEVIIIVNAPSGASAGSIANNKKCISNIESWRKNNRSFFRLFVFDAGPSPKEDWGVGLARKTGMDEAVRRFDMTGNPEGVIASLDADCTVEKNYFTAISDGLLRRKERSACSIYFEHPLSGSEFPEQVYQYIIQYELHLRYFIQGLKYSGFPYAFHTVGSALAVKALQYVRAGGMNRRQAGEDFYFVQKLIPSGGYFSLNSTTVYPSPRESYRVPFGTGVMMTKLLGDSDRQMMTYNVSAFMELNDLFGSAGDLFTADRIGIVDFHKNLPPGLRSFTGIDDWSERIDEIKDNTSSQESFMKRFFGWFNTFRIVKYMNHVHAGLFTKKAVADSAYDLLSISGLKFPEPDQEKLLLYYRSMEKDAGRY